MAGAALISGALSASHVQAQDFSGCKGIVFSTEEDFITRGRETPDGNPIISDGDLIAFDQLSSASKVCARNNELIRRFDVEEDMGVDAVDVILAEKGIIAFSTELDSPHGNFGNGDILFPDGTVIPNIALVNQFKLNDNVGLDGVHFIGDRDRILDLIEKVRSVGSDELRRDPKILPELLKELGVDIWFTIEGTGPTPKAPGILDGDLLSAATGSKVAPQSALLDPPIPAGIPNRGVDFGLDAVTADRSGRKERMLLSTEILYRGKPAPFTDGDILRVGGAVVVPHEALIKSLEPVADFVGLDAVSGAFRQLGEAPHLDTLCGDAHDASDFDTFGLWRAGFGATPPGTPPRRPCGNYVPVDGTLPLTGVTRFRIAYRPAGDPVPPVGTAPGIETKWKLRAPHPVFPWLCSSAAIASVPLETDANGWMDAQDYLDGKVGALGGISAGCANSGLRLAVWNTKALPTEVERNGRYTVWLEWEEAGGALMREALEYNVQLDNKAPEIAPYPNGLEVRLADGSGKRVPACGEAPTDASEFEVWAQFSDPHYWYFRLTVEGGEPPVSYAFKRAGADTTHEYFEAPDGPPGLKNTDDTGTVPDLSTVHLRNIDMTELGASFKRCCYLLRLRVYDAAILHGFNGLAANPGSPHSAFAITTFQAGS